MYKLIIVDDETLALEQLVATVDWELFGFEIFSVFDDGAAALECLKKERIDLVLTDIRMPDVDGVEIAKYCYENLPDTLVAFISSYDSFEYARQAVRYNIMDYILKPFSYKQLTEMLEHAEMLLDNKFGKSFVSDEIQLQREKFFSDLFFGSIKNETTLKERLELIGLSERLSEAPAIMLNLTVENFEEYLKKTWKYGKDRLYSAIANISFEDTNSNIFCVMMYAYDSIRIIGIQKEKKPALRSLAEKYCERLSADLFEILMLKTKTEILKEFGALNDIIEESAFEMTEKSKEKNIKEQIMKYLKKNYQRDDISLTSLAEYMCYNKVYFCSYYRRHMNENFTTTLNRMRIEKAKELLKNPNIKASSIYSKVGYKSAPYFYKIFKSFVGKTPAEYQLEVTKEK
jgi:two-component system response regulator YesN